MASETSWLELVLIALSQSDINLLNEYSSTLTKKLHSAQKFSDEDLILLLVDKRKLFRDFRAEFTSQKTLFLRIVKNQNTWVVALK